MKKYEIVYILDPTLKDPQPVIDKINLWLTNKNGKIIAKEEWGIRDLAYPILKQSKGNYFLVIVETASENILTFKKMSRINREILRTFVLNTELQKNYQQSTVLNATKLTPEEFKAQIMNSNYNRRFNPHHNKAKEDQDKVTDTATINTDNQKFEKETITNEPS